LPSRLDALTCSACRCALFVLLVVSGRRPGLRPGGRLTFFASPKKVSKKRRPDVPALLRRVRCAAQLGRGLAKLAIAQTDASPVSAQVCAARRARREGGSGSRRLLLRSDAVLFHPEGAAASQRGWVPALCPTEPTQIHPALLDAQALPISSVPSQARPYPLCPWGRAEQRSARGIRPRVCLSASEFSGDPPGASSAGNHEVALTSGRLSFGYFALAKQRKVPRPPGRTPGLRPSTKNRTIRAQRQQSPSASSPEPAPACPVAQGRAALHWSGCVHDFSGTFLPLRSGRRGA